MNMVHVCDCMTNAVLVVFEASSIFLISPYVFFADGKQYNTATEVYLEIIQPNGEWQVQNKSAARPLYDVQILGVSHTQTQGR